MSNFAQFSPRALSLVPQRNEASATRSRTPAGHPQWFFDSRYPPACRKSLWVDAASGYFYRVGGRTMARRKLSISRAQEVRTLILVLAASLAPALLFMIGIAATLQDDLSDLAPILFT